MWVALDGEVAEDVGAEVGLRSGLVGVGEPSGSAGGVVLGSDLQGAAAGSGGVFGGGEDVGEAAAEGFVLGWGEGAAGELVEQGEADAVGLGDLREALEEVVGGSVGEAGLGAAGEGEQEESNDMGTKGQADRKNTKFTAQNARQIQIHQYPKGKKRRLRFSMGSKVTHPT